MVHGIREALIASGNFPDLLTAEQVSALPGVSAATLNRWAAIRERTGQQVGPPCYLLSERCAAGIAPRGPQNGSKGYSADGRKQPARYPQAPERIRPAPLPGALSRVRDASSSSGWAETSVTFATLREAKAFKADRDNETA